MSTYRPTLSCRVSILVLTVFLFYLSFSPSTWKWSVLKIIKFHRNWHFYIKSSQFYVPIKSWYWSDLDTQPVQHDVRDWCQPTKHLCTELRAFYTLHVWYGLSKSQCNWSLMPVEMWSNSCRLSCNSLLGCMVTNAFIMIL